MSNLRHTLRFRLALWYALSLAMVLTAFGLLLYGVVKYHLIRHHDTALKDAAFEVARVLSQQEDCEHLNDSQRAELDRIGQLILFHEVEGEGRVFYRSTDAPGELAEIPTLALSQALGEETYQTIFLRNASLRIYAKPYHSRMGRRGLIHVAHSLGDVPAPLASLRLALLIMAPLAVLLSGAGGYWLAGRALTPVDEITRTVMEIEAKSLSQRLPQPRAEDEIGRLTHTFNQMIGRLEASFEGMKRFTADASHELRGPLTTMRTAIDVGLSKARDGDEYREVLASVGEDVDRLRSITEDLLVLARADAGRIMLQRNRIRLDLLIPEIVESLRPVAAQSGVGLFTQCSKEALVEGDERWLRQLFSNLLDNAIKFSATDGKGGHSGLVNVEANVSNGVIEIRVSDSGVGIPEHALDHIFERFYRADEARTYGQREGSGLGLAIAKWIIDVHAGKISAQNRTGGGSLFMVTLPAANQ